jgi:hypothetical protein
MSPSKVALVVTTIQGPNAVMRELAQSAKAANAGFFVVGDRKSPPGPYQLPGTEYFSLEQQHQRFGAFSRQLPEGHYVRKNLGYLAALDSGADWIVETDDDNFPHADFLHLPTASMPVRRIAGGGWINVYNHFGPTQAIWPRGLPLDQVMQAERTISSAVDGDEQPLIVQGLANDNPDVDAVYRLTRPLPVTFDHKALPLALSKGQWCPFNSQNTWFRRDVAALLYLPAYCSFRMTDIWRSFVAQRCLWAMGGSLIFVAPTVRQERNEHNLMRDFADEVSGYLKNDAIRRCLDDCQLTGQPLEDLLRCYEAMIQAAIFPRDEAELVQAWIAEVSRRVA